MELKDKLTDEASVRDAISRLQNSLSYESFQRQLFELYGDYEALVKKPNGFLTDVPFWAVREEARLSTKQYEVSSVLHLLNKAQPLFAHVSTVDKSHIAFTPDKASGMADRQIHMAAGRFFSKFLPVFADHAVAALTEDHLGEILCEIEWIEGEAIAATYRTMDGTGACMSNKHFDVEPTLAYDAPGIKLAVLRTKSGSIRARTMVFEASESDKRWIRLYGDSRLRHMLERLGYKNGAWQGAKFRKVRTSRPGVYAMPYLDANNGHSVRNGSGVAMIDGEICCLTDAQHTAFSTLGLPTCIPSSGGTVELQDASSKAFEGVDCITGEAYSALRGDSVVEVLLETGMLGMALASNVLAAFTRHRYFSSTAGHRIGTKLVYTKLPAFYDYGSGHNYVDLPHIREACGHRKLSPELGYESGAYKPPSEYAEIERTVDGEARTLYALAKDVVYIVGEGKQMRSTLARGDIKLHKAHGVEEGWVRKGATVYKTASGRKVHPVYNRDIVKLIDDSYELPRNVKLETTLMGERVYARSREHLHEHFDTWLEARIDDLTSDHRQGVTDLLYELGYYGLIRPEKSGLRHFQSGTRASDFYKLTLAHVEEVVQQVVKVERGYTRHPLQLKALRRWLVWAAEAQAVEEPIRAKGVPEAGSMAIEQLMRDAALFDAACEAPVPSLPEADVVIVSQEAPVASESHF